MKWSGGGIPYGYSYDFSQRKLIINPLEAKIVKLIYKLAEGGEGIKAITNYLNQNKFKTRYAKKWNVTLVRGILYRYKFYQGIGYDGTLGDWQPIIFNKPIYDQFRKINYPKNVEKINRNEYLLSGFGILKCGYCGGTVKAVVVPKKNSKKFYYYLCTNKQTGGKSLCPKSKLVRMDMVDNIVLLQIKLVTLNSTLIQKFIKRHNNLLNKQIQNLIADMQKNTLQNPHMVMEIINKYQGRISELKAQIVTYQPIAHRGRSKRNFILSNISSIKIFNDKLVLKFLYPINSELNQEKEVFYNEAA